MTATLYRMTDSGVSTVWEFDTMEKAITVINGLKLLDNGHEYMIGNAG